MLQLTKINKIADLLATLSESATSRLAIMFYSTSRATKTVFLKAAAALAVAVAASATYAESPPHHGHIAGNAAAPFVASTAKPFSALMHDAMDIMDDGMRRAPMSGVPEHDFVTMIPHHQGAIDMAKGLLLYTKDPALINLAQSIITEQQNEIRLMEAWLKRYEQQQEGAKRPNK